jgi:type IV pilus assembly protein PilA
MKRARCVGALLIGMSVAVAAIAQPAPPVLTEELASKILKLSPAFTGANAGRKFTRVVNLNHLQEGDQEGWGVDLEWTEGGQTHKGVAPILRVPAGMEKQPWFYQHEGWGITTFLADKTFAEVQAMTKGARQQANEAAAIGDLRVVLTGEIAYSTANGGAYDELRCLAEPAQCLPGYTGPHFADASLVKPEKTGYRRKFYPGARLAKGKDVKSASSIATFAYTAVPITVGETGQRGFCTDDRGMICFTPDGSEPKTSGGRCADPCQAL